MQVMHGRLGLLIPAAFVCALLAAPSTTAAPTEPGSADVGTTHPTRHITNGAGGLACGGRFDAGCGTGVVTHADGSLSLDGRPTGGGVAPGYPRP
ncbi:hypothetical protein [Streptomyces sp. NBC_01314]|uniref:hypothetical protein n=1 Tax=Streptomyces sp. NBC_01314 TaxID=2903821 RepID=UPI00309142F4|nr:hypothetical protein OG622_26355 [Streptomyces sp. NBC_01314]